MYTQLHDITEKIKKYEELYTYNSKLLNFCDNKNYLMIPEKGMSGAVIKKSTDDKYIVKEDCADKSILSEAIVSKYISDNFSENFIKNI
jgi:hypothetical protein